MFSKPKELIKHNKFFFREEEEMEQRRQRELERREELKRQKKEKNRLRKEEMIQAEKLVCAKKFFNRLFPYARAAYYQNVMHYSTYRGISIECDI